MHFRQESEGLVLRLCHHTRQSKLLRSGLCRQSLTPIDVQVRVIVQVRKKDFLFTQKSAVKTMPEDGKTSAIGKSFDGR